MQLHLGKHEEAIKCYDKVIEIDPEDLLVWNNKAVTLRQLGKYEEAMKCFDKIIQLEDWDY